MAISAPLFAFSMDAMVYCVTTLFMVGFWLILVDAGFVYRMDLNSLLKAKKAMNPIGKSKSVYFKIFYVVVYAYILYFLLHTGLHTCELLFHDLCVRWYCMLTCQHFKYIYPEAVTW